MASLSETRTVPGISDIAVVADIVCRELGIPSGETTRRRAVEERILRAYGAGRRHPLNLVTAGLDF